METAQPIAQPIAQPTLTAKHIDVLHLLIAGDRRPVIANTLHLSTRSVDLRVARIKDVLDARDRWRLGVRSVRWGLVDRIHPIRHAMARRTGADWVPPTDRQREILRLRTDGATLDEVAAKLSLSTRTVRLDIGRLATANGARNAVSASALFEALDWT